jgi:hypothetical protein
VKYMLKTKKQVTTLVNFILDKSGSMGIIRKQTIDGFNEYINGLKNQDKDIRFSLTLFDTVSIEKPYINVPIKEVKPLDLDTYRPNAATPLYDAVVNTIEQVSEEVAKMETKPAVVTVIMTDGEENSSQQHNQNCLIDIKKQLQKEGNWTFVFMGANQDAWATAQKWGFDKGNVMNWSATPQGTKSALRGLTGATVAFAASAADSKDTRFSSDSFFDKGGDK